MMDIFLCIRCVLFCSNSHHTYYFLLYLTDHTIIEQYITSMPIIDKDAMVCGNCGKADDLMENAKGVRVQYVRILMICVFVGVCVCTLFSHRILILNSLSLFYK